MSIVRTIAFCIGYMSTLLIRSGYGQELQVVPDQNPKYQESQKKYTTMVDSNSYTLSTTLQETYQADDWYEAKQARKQQRKQWRHQERMARSTAPRINYYCDYWWPYNYGSFYDRAWIYPWLTYRWGQVWWGWYP